MNRYPHHLLGINGQKFFGRMRVGTSFYINVYENYNTGSMFHDDRLNAQISSNLMTTSKNGLKPVKTLYRIKITKIKKCKKGWIPTYGGSL